MVVTQPGFVAERGDDYLRDVEPVDQGALYPVRSLLDAGIVVRGSSDAPFGGSDCWAAMRAAVERRTPSGVVLGPHERLCARQAYALFAGDDARALAVGARADLTVLAVPFEQALRELDTRNVVATVVRGAVVRCPP